MGALTFSTDFSSSYFNPVHGRCGLPLSFINFTDLADVTLITFTRGTPVHSKDIKILANPNLTYVSVGTAISNSYQITSKGYSYNVFGIGSSYGYDNVIEIEYTGGGIGDPSFDIEASGPFVFKVITPHSDADNFKAILAVLENPDIDDYILINPPKNNYSVQLTHVWNYSLYEYKLVSHKIFPNYYIDRESKTWNVKCDVDLSTILRDYLTIGPPKFNWDNDPTWIFRFVFQPEACKTISTYYSIVSETQTNRSQQYLSVPANQSSYKLSDYEVYLGSCRYPDNTFIPLNDYHNSGGAFVYPLKSDYEGTNKYSSYMCPGNTHFFYCYVPDNTEWDMYVTYVAYDEANNILYSEAAAEAYPTAGEPGIYYWEVGYLVNTLHNLYPNLHRVNVQYRRSTGSYSTYPFDIYLKKTDDCEECGIGVQFAYLSSMGIYELISLIPQNELNFEGKAVDISHEKRGFFSSLLHPNRRFIHRNRGITSEKIEKFFTLSYDTSEYTMNLLLDFFSSSDVYMIKEYGNLIPVNVEPSNFIVSKGTSQQRFEVTVKYLGIDQYTNNKF